MVKAARWVAVALTTVSAMGACSGGDGGDRRTSQRPPGTSTTRAAGESPDGADHYGPARLVGALADATVTESSGLVASRRNPGVLWTHNDSGAKPVVHCVRPDAASCGRWAVPGAGAVDWEDIAAGPGPERGTSYLYIGDIGDNGRTRPSVVVYRVPEPAVPDSGDGGAVEADHTTAAPTALRFSYPDGPHDAEALLVHPTTGDLYIVTKDAVPRVYRATAPVAGDVTIRLALVTSLRPSFLPFDRISGGDISPDGLRVVLCTYADGEERTSPADGGPFDRIWEQPVTSVDLGVRDQGEAVAYRLDGQAILATSEGAASPLYQTERR